MVPTACPLTPMARLPGTLASLPLPPSAPASATLSTASPLEALGMGNLTVQVVARPLPHCGHGSALVGGIATQPKRWLYGSFAAGRAWGGGGGRMPPAAGAVSMRVLRGGLGPGGGGRRRPSPPRWANPR